MSNNKKINKSVLANSLLLVLRLLLLVLIFEVYTWHIAVIDRGYPSNENTYFGISVAWLPIILATVCAAVNAVRLILACKRKTVPYKTDALSFIAEIAVAFVYALPVTAFAKNIPASAFKALLITLCAVLAAFTLFRGVCYMMNTITAKSENGGDCGVSA